MSDDSSASSPAQGTSSPTAESVEIAGLRTNLTLITDIVTDMCTPQWFANRLVEKSFITHDSSKGILGNSGLTPADKTSQLMNSVFTKIRITDKKQHWFNEFVAVFSTESVCAELVERLKHSVSNTSTSPDHPANQPPPSPHQHHASGIHSSIAKMNTHNYFKGQLHSTFFSDKAL